MTVLLSDTGSGSGALGTSQVGGRPFVQTPAGAFTRSSGRFATGVAMGSNPTALLDAGFGDIDLSLSVNGSGGDCLYWRYRNIATWMRLRVRSWQSGTGSSSPYWDGTYDVGPWQYQGSQCFLPGDGGYQSGTTYYNYVGGYPTEYVVNGGSVCYEEPGHYQGTLGGVYTRSVTQHMVGGGSYPIYSYETVLERCDGGTVTTLASYAGQPSTLRVTDNRSTVTCYINGSAQAPVAVRSTNGGTQVGFGIAGPTTLSGSALANLSVKVNKSSWGLVT